jgi:hypothetical protein
MILSQLSNTDSFILYNISNTQEVPSVIPHLESLCTRIFSSALLQRCTAKTDIEQKELSSVTKAALAWIKKITEYGATPKSPKEQKEHPEKLLHFYEEIFSVFANSGYALPEVFHKESSIMKAVFYLENLPTIIAQKYKLKTFDWFIETGIQALKKALQKSGPMIPPTTIGTHRYAVAPKAQEEQIEGNVIYYFPKGSKITCITTPCLSFSVLVGIDSIKNRVFFYEENPDKKIIWVISWERFLNFAQDSPSGKPIKSIPLLYSPNFS